MSDTAQRLEAAEQAIADARKELMTTLDDHFGFWSSPQHGEQRRRVYDAYKILDAAHATGQQWVLPNGRVTSEPGVGRAVGTPLATGQRQGGDDDKS